MPEEQQQETSATTETSRDWKAEAEKMSAEIRQFHKERDEWKRKAREYEARALSEDALKEYETLKEKDAKAEDERKRKAGEFDAWRVDISKKHDEAVKAEQAKREQAEAKLRQKLVGLEFAAASSLFGEAGKTVLTPEIAEAYFGRFVDVVADDQGVERVVIKGHDGHVILDAKTGRAASFADAMAEVIDGLPNKDRILRGSGKTGSGSSGGSTRGAQEVDLGHLKPADFRDPKIREALKQRQAAAGGLQIGPAWDRVAK